MFSRLDIRELLNQYTLLQLYTDKVPPRFEPTTSAEENREFQFTAFGDRQLPLYVVLEPLGNGKFKEVARYNEGKINNVAAFTEFLHKPLETNGTGGIQVGAK